VFSETAKRKCSSLPVLSIDINEQGALRTGVLKPQVMRAIDLNQFAEAIAPTARLMQLPSTFRVGWVPR
jgi:hypothetical protein